MSGLQVAVASTLATACLLLAGCQGKSKVRPPAGPPTFEAVVAIKSLPGNPPADEKSVAEALEVRADLGLESFRSLAPPP